MNSTCPFFVTFTCIKNRVMFHKSMESYIASIMHQHTIANDMLTLSLSLVPLGKIMCS